MITDHIKSDDRHFEKIETSLAGMKGALAVLIGLVIGSGALNFFVGHP